MKTIKKRVAKPEPKGELPETERGYLRSAEQYVAEKARRLLLAQDELRVAVEQERSLKEQIGRLYPALV